MESQGGVGGSEDSRILTQSGLQMFASSESQGPTRPCLFRAEITGN